MFIKLKIKNKQIELSVSEAEELFDQLNQVFKKDNNLSNYPFIPQHYEPYPLQPSFPVHPYTYPWCQTITCDSAGTTTKSYLGDSPDRNLNKKCN